MEKLVRVRIEQDDSITAANKLLDNGWVITTVIPYKGSDFRNQYLMLLTMPPEGEEAERWRPDEDDEDDEDDNDDRFKKEI